MNQIRTFAQSPRPSEPTILDGWKGVKGLAERVRARFEVLDRYEENNVFVPTLSQFDRFLQFVRLQSPSNTEIDAIEFLCGAQHAIDLAINTIMSSEVSQFARGEIEQSPAVAKLQSIMAPYCFYTLMKDLEGFGPIQLNSLSINSVQIQEVIWGSSTMDSRKTFDYKPLVRANELIRLRRAHAKNLLDQLGNDKGKQQVGMVNPNSIVFDEANDHKTEVQVLEITVLVDAVENITTRKGEEETTVDRQSVSLWTFETLVTHPEDVDWRILKQSICSSNTI